MIPSLDEVLQKKATAWKKTSATTENYGLNHVKKHF